MLIRFHKHTIVGLFICALSVVTIVLYLKNLHYVRTIHFISDYQKSTIIRRAKQWQNDTQNDEWQILGDSTRRQQIYSAFFDNRPEILDVGYIKTVEALEALPIHEHYGLPYAAFTVMCPLVNSELDPVVELPKYVVLADNEDPVTLNTPTYIPIRYGEEDAWDSKPSRNLAICAGPIHNSYAQARRIVEYVHIYQLMGVEKFYFYNLNIDKHVNEVLQYFQRNGTVQILNWNLNGYESEKDIRYAGIFAALNECTYRATLIDNFKYVAIVDLDEILVTFKQNNLVDFLQSIDTENTESFVFRGVFFHENDEIASYEEATDAKNKFLYTQSRIVRTRDPFPVNIRSKYIVKGRAAIELGNHFVWRTISSANQKAIDPSDGLLYHYRDNCLDLTCDTTKQVDTTLRRYGKELRALVDKTCGEIFHDGACPIN